jgi:hypothetical protein
VETDVDIYPDLVAEPAVAAPLPDEAPDVTVTELHARVVMRLAAALGYALAGQAAVLTDIFVRAETDQAAPDLLIAPGVAPGRRTVYRLSEDPVPAVTIEVLSPTNRRGEGRVLLERKHAFFSRIGVPRHYEIDPDRGGITTWTRRGGTLVQVASSDSLTGPDLGGVRITTPAPGEVRVFTPDGREVLDPADELARAEEQRRRADRLADRLRSLGVDPDQ